jgi:hypothetical protein
MIPGKDAQKQASDKRREDEKLDQAIDDSFPASDPPPMSPTTTGAPKQGRATERTTTGADPERRKR